MDDFLKWLEQNDKELSTNFYRYTCTSKYECTAKQRIKWLDLGARYTAYKYNIKLDFSKLSFVFCQNRNCSMLGTGKIQLKGNGEHHFLNDFNLACMR